MALIRVCDRCKKTVENGQVVVLQKILAILSQKISTKMIMYPRAERKDQEICAECLDEYRELMRKWWKIEASDIDAHYFCYECQWVFVGTFELGCPRCENHHLISSLSTSSKT